MKNLKFIILSLIFSLYILCATFYISSVFAHVLKSDGSVGVVMHIDPEDDPIVGQPASFFLEFKEKNETFKADNCNCKLSIYKDGKEIFSQPLSLDSSNSGVYQSAVYFTFPEKNVYTIKIAGLPKSEGNFQPFNLSYDLRVSREPDSQPAKTESESSRWIKNHIPHLIGSFLIAGFFIYAMIKQSKGKK